ncbi:helix-turn-helix domain-containing protein [Paenibacillus kribbensis]|uniref:winged helix-turn-helix transcriptional regulator n=1 Tax=Paenibacillus kribbensis TaxID=172713 RepID=UPI002DBCBD71|nr:helix-turn-helix domain-containing protein [Paenibacillus kribbensis]MEC0236142.1 helix-turn-helix domain-containing protein [Paenibacillus kribbensis]
MKSTEEMVCIKTIKETMDIFSGKWAIIIIGALHAGAKRFNELSKELGIRTTSLSDALKSLESNGIVTRTVYPTIPITVEYSLTEKGSDFGEIFLAINDWGIKWIKHDIDYSK